MKAELYKHHCARVSRQYENLSGWERRIRDQLPLKNRYRETPYDPSDRPTSRPHCDDPYFEVWSDAVHASAVRGRGGEIVDATVVVQDVGEKKDDEDGDVDAANDPQPSEYCGSPRDS